MDFEVDFAFATAISLMYPSVFDYIAVCVCVCLFFIVYTYALD